MSNKAVRYTREFKRQMVDLVRSGRTPASLAKEFGPTPWSISLWVKQDERDTGKGDGGLTSTEREELARLCRENRKLKEELSIELLTDAARRSELNEWLSRKVRPMFERRVLEITEEVVLKWRLLVEEGRKVGHTFSQPDLIIAATAQHHGITVVTRNIADYAKAQVAVFNPWGA